MAVANSARLDIRGSLVGGAEIFSTSLWLTNNTVGQSVPSTNGEAQSCVDGIAALAETSTFLNSWLAFCRPDDSVNKLVLYCYPQGGRSAAAIAEHDLTGKVGSSGATTLPSTTCRVLTLRTGQAGRSFRGRMYLPFDGGAISATTRMFTDSGQTITDAFVAWVRALRLSAVMPGGNGANPVIASGVKGVLTSIEQATMDSKPDVQRRRSDKLTSGAVSSSNV